MKNFLVEYYLWTKAFHVISIISWMAGMFYMPRLFVYHVAYDNGTKMSDQFLLMERRLLKIIINPAMFLATVFGFILLFTPGVVAFSDGWLHVKLFFVLILFILHGFMVKWYKELQAGLRDRSSRFYRIVNEIPPIVMMVIVVLVIVKPF